MTITTRSSYPQNNLSTPPPAEERPPSRKEILSLFLKGRDAFEQLKAAFQSPYPLVESPFGFVPKQYVISKLEIEVCNAEQNYREKLNFYLKSGKSRDLLAETFSMGNKEQQEKFLAILNEHSPN